MYTIHQQLRRFCKWVLNQQIMYFSNSVILQKPYYKHSTILLELMNITPDEMLQHAKNLFKSFNTTCFVHGNLLKDKVWLVLCVCVCLYCIYVYVWYVWRSRFLLWYECPTIPYGTYIYVHNSENLQSLLKWCSKTIPELDGVNQALTHGHWWSWQCLTCHVMIDHIDNVSTCT